MKKIEIKSIDPTSAFKATIYLSIVPLALVGFLGLMLTVVGLITNAHTITIFGVTYLFMPIVFMVLYGLFAMLGSWIYSKLAGKFGGLEVTVVDKDQPVTDALQAIDTQGI